MENKNLTTGQWRDYILIDSGDNKKFEQFGQYFLIRPETQAIWRAEDPDLWKRTNAEFRFEGGKGSWLGKMPKSWNMEWKDGVRFTLHLTAFKHVGFFPEQEPNWEWIGERVDHLKKTLAQPPRILNLFGYTGIASIVAAKHGAMVTHLDASKQSNTWAKENATTSDVPADSVRYITDDAIKFVEREARRGSVYDGIILDPPAFGRGPDGEVWHIEEHLSALLDAIVKIFNDKPGSFFLLNGYAAGYSPISLLQSVESSFPELIGKYLSGGAVNGEFGELRIQESPLAKTVPKRSIRYVSSGIYVRFIR